MFEERTRLIIQEKYVELVNYVIDTLKSTSVKKIQEKLETRYENVWDAFIYQVETDDSDAIYYVFISFINEICVRTVETLALTELKLLWLISDGCLEWEEETTDFPEVDQMLDDVAEELLSWVEQEAEEPELEDEDALYYEER